MLVKFHSFSHLQYPLYLGQGCGNNGREAGLHPGFGVWPFGCIWLFAMFGGWVVKCLHDCTDTKTYYYNTFNQTWMSYSTILSPQTVFSTWGTGSTWLCITEDAFLRCGCITVVVISCLRSWSSSFSIFSMIPQSLSLENSNWPRSLLGRGKHNTQSNSITIFFWSLWPLLSSHVAVYSRE